ncbi:serine/arginine repetitive matrix protein 1-like [Sorghum bicolor]|uniref:serine/arginine repetitive matrix protein 1-like n=1 Tax=Sorghum bicolor TaxID=4558 RepID=UPI000B4246D5|nr:serine/arginine repetitive matrix protein 1-like [Sorghum bicolor]|eukprot:XP_021315202.1 serine/arginine repetitive matrix protein 1-like [Sorghum bicolor]
MATVGTGRRVDGGDLTFACPSPVVRPRLRICVLGNKQRPPSPPRSPPPSCERTRLASSPRPQASPSRLQRRPPHSRLARRAPARLACRAPRPPSPVRRRAPRPPSAVRRSRLARRAPSAALACEPRSPAPSAALASERRLASPAERRPPLSPRPSSAVPPRASVVAVRLAPSAARPACQPKPCTADHQRHSSHDTRAPAAPSPRHRALGHRPTAPLSLGLSDRRCSSDQTRRVESLKIRAAGLAALNRRSGLLGLFHSASRSNHGLQKQAEALSSSLGLSLLLSNTLHLAAAQPRSSHPSARVSECGPSRKGTKVICFKRSFLPLTLLNLRNRGSCVIHWSFDHSTTTLQNYRSLKLVQA